MLLNVNVLDADLDNVAGLEELGGVADEAVAHLGDVEQAVVVNADVNEATEVNHVSDSTLQLHFGLQVVDVKNVGGENGCGCVVTDITAGLLKLGDNVLKSRLTDSESVSSLFKAVSLYIFGNCAEILGFLYVNIAKL